MAKTSQKSTTSKATTKPKSKSTSKSTSKTTARAKSQDMSNYEKWRLKYPNGIDLKDVDWSVLGLERKPRGLKKLSRIGEWWLANPKGLEVIYIDWKALGVDPPPKKKAKPKAVAASKPTSKPKTLSKVGEWRRANPRAKGASGKIRGMKAVVK